MTLASTDHPRSVAGRWLLLVGVNVVLGSVAIVPMVFGWPILQAEVLAPLGLSNDPGFIYLDPGLERNVTVAANLVLLGGWLLLNHSLRQEWSLRWAWLVAACAALAPISVAGGPGQL
ncbi:hypothetical protein [Luteipulveratus mongoliensis]|uniref:hypothetical protein n=1 Tax=Luteipulveratus mongoliensis TaxID=571913 RepID=UPI0012EE17C3|nr:hypothetical protein [Luteipulveratus mongoliensis]